MDRPNWLDDFYEQLQILADIVPNEGDGAELYTVISRWITECHRKRTEMAEMISAFADRLVYTRPKDWC
jgi:hypothetical protein